MNPLFNFFAYFVWFFATYYIVVFVLVLFSEKKRLYERKHMPKGTVPFVTVIVPAYNEEGKIARTIASLKKIAYERIEFIVVNDGSNDNTAAEARTAIGSDKRFSFINRKENHGKAYSLNEGIARARGEFVATIDADSIVESHIFQKTLPYLLEDKNMGAVTVSVVVDKPKGLLHKIIQIEYMVGLSLFLKVFSTFNCVFVTPGPFSLYRKNVLDTIGGFDVGNMTEDLEIAYRIHRHHYTIGNCLEASVRTIVPPRFKDVYRQRRRWYAGAIQTVIKHRDMLFSNKYGVFGYFLPFNFFLIFAGLLLALFATYLGVKNIVNTLWSYQYTGFNIFERLFDWNLDLMATAQVSIIGYTAFIAGIGIMILSLIITHARINKKKTGIVGYSMLFFLYQIWWIGGVFAWARARGKKLAWR